MDNNLSNFIQQNSPDGGFLQSEHWRKFQETWGREVNDFAKTSEDGETIVHANIIEHSLPVVGKYFYIPRGPVITQSAKRKAQSHSAKLKTFLDEMIRLAKKRNAGWIRIEPNSEEDLGLIKDNVPAKYKIKKSAVDMQPREILILDISGSEEEILGKMKQKTRYNVRLAEKKGIKIFTTREEKYIDEFCRLVKITARRDKINPHPESYYRKMFEFIPPEVLKLYAVEYEGKIIAANFVLFFGRTATYMHGASYNEHRNIMAPHLLQWQQILDAKKEGCEKYDFGGVKTGNAGGKSWEGITRFKTGFAPDSKPQEFPGCYDIVLNSNKYHLYRLIKKVKRIF